MDIQCHPGLRAALYRDQIIAANRRVDSALIQLLDKPSPRVGYIPSAPDPERRFFNAKVSYYGAYGIDNITYCDPAEFVSHREVDNLLDCDAIHLSGGDIGQRVGWVKPDDALLALDLNDNGLIHNQTELFGNNMKLLEAAHCKRFLSQMGTSLKHAALSIFIMIILASASYAQDRILPDRSSLVVTMVQHADAFGKEEVCRAVDEELKNRPPLPNEYEFTKDFKSSRFSAPAWKQLDPAQNVDLVKTILLAHTSHPSSRGRSISEQQRANEQATAIRELPKLMEDYKKGRLALDLAEIDLEGDREPELVYRLLHPVVDDIFRDNTPWLFNENSREEAPLGWWYFVVNRNDQSPIQLGNRVGSSRSYVFDIVMFEGKPFFCRGRLR